MAKEVTEIVWEPEGCGVISVLLQDKSLLRLSLSLSRSLSLSLALSLSLGLDPDFSVWHSLSRSPALGLSSATSRNVLPGGGLTKVLTECILMKTWGWRNVGGWVNTGRAMCRSKVRECDQDSFRVVLWGIILSGLKVFCCGQPLQWILYKLVEKREVGAAVWSGAKQLPPSHFSKWIRCFKQTHSCHPLSH